MIAEQEVSFDDYVCIMTKRENTMIDYQHNYEQERMKNKKKMEIEKKLMHRNDFALEESKATD